MVSIFRICPLLLHHLQDHIAVLIGHGLLYPQQLAGLHPVSRLPKLYGGQVTPSLTAPQSQNPRRSLATPVVLLNQPSQIRHKSRRDLMYRYLVSIRKRSFSALAVSIIGLACAAYPSPYPSPKGGGYTVHPLPLGEGGQRPSEGPPRNPSISLPGRKMPRFRIGNQQFLIRSFRIGNQ